MDTARFKRNVFRTLSIKGAKFGLRGVARKTLSTNVMHAVVGLATQRGRLFKGLEPYLLGFQLNASMKERAFEELGSYSYYMVLLAKSLKLKIPGSGKKLRLIGTTKTEALMRLDTLTTDMLEVVHEVFHGDELDLVRMDQLALLGQQAIELYWPLVYDLLGVAPAVVFDAQMMKLAQQYPNGLFSDDPEEFRQAAAAYKASIAVLTAASQAAPVEPAGEGSAPAEPAAVPAAASAPAKAKKTPPKKKPKAAPVNKGDPASTPDPEPALAEPAKTGS